MSHQPLFVELLDGFFWPEIKYHLPLHACANKTSGTSHGWNCESRQRDVKIVQETIKLCPLWLLIWFRGSLPNSLFAYRSNLIKHIRGPVFLFISECNNEEKYDLNFVFKILKEQKDIKQPKTLLTNLTHEIILKWNINIADKKRVRIGNNDWPVLILLSRYATEQLKQKRSLTCSFKKKGV